MHDLATACIGILQQPKSSILMHSCSTIYKGAPLEGPVMPFTS
jgi:hypothetical protein